MSKVVGFVVGAALVVVGIVTGNPYLIIQGGLMIVSNAIMLLTMPKAPARQASEMRLQLGEQPRSAIFGEAFVAGSLVDGFNYGGKYGTDWECLIIRLADHKCAGLTSFYVNDELVEYTGNGNYPQFDSDHFELYFRADTSAESLPAVVTAHAPGWSSADIGESGCDVVVCYRADKPDAKHPAWPGGRPRFGFVVQGKLCYDPRLDSTVTGGSGSHRWDDPSTWEWSDNPAVCRYNWVRGIYANDQVFDPSQLLIGRGLSEAEAPPENIFAAANLCDELISSEKRYRVDGPVYANQTFLEVEEMFAVCCGGSVVTREGSVELEPGQAKSVVAVFTDDDLLVGSKISWNEGILSDSNGEWINSVVARYFEPAQKWNDHAAPVVRSFDDILADGRPRETSITLRLVRRVAQALRVAEIARRMGRVWGRASVTLGPRFCELEDGDWVNWTSARRFGGATKTFRVEAYSINEKWQPTLTLREINSSIFGDDAYFDPDQSEANPNPPPPDVGSPDGGAWTLSAVTLTSSGAIVPAIVISGACDDDAASAIIFEYWKSDGIINPVTDPDDPPWTSAGTLVPSTTRVEITSITSGAVYYAAVTYVVSGGPGERLVLGPVTAGSLDVSGQVTPAVNSAVGALPWKMAVRAKTTAALPTNSYSNGSSGVGATLTGSSNGALAAQDGVTLVANDRLLVADEATGARNGIYVLTQVGDASHPYILTRSTDADAAAELVCATVKVSEGSANADSEWMCTTNAAITVGTTSLAFAPKGGGNGIAVEDEGTQEGTGIDRLNFTGAGVSVTVVGTEAEIIISGSGSGGGLWSAAGGAYTTVGVWDFAADGAAANIDFTGLAGATDIRIIMHNVPKSVSAAPFLYVSVNNGSSYYTASGDYAFIDAAGGITNTTSMGQFHLTNASAARNGIVEILNANKPLPIGLNVNANTSHRYFLASTSAINAVRIAPGPAANFTGGKVYCLIRT